MFDKRAKSVAYLESQLCRKEAEVRYVPLPRPEEVEAWVRLAYERGRRDGALWVLRESSHDLGRTP